MMQHDPPLVQIDVIRAGGVEAGQCVHDAQRFRDRTVQLRGVCEQAEFQRILTAGLPVTADCHVQVQQQLSLFPVHPLRQLRDKLVQAHVPDLGQVETFVFVDGAHGHAVSDDLAVLQDPQDPFVQFLRFYLPFVIPHQRLERRKVFTAQQIDIYLRSFQVQKRKPFFYTVPEEAVSFAGSAGGVGHIQPRQRIKPDVVFYVIVILLRRRNQYILPPFRRFLRRAGYSRRADNRTVPGSRCRRSGRRARSCMALPRTDINE